MHNYQVLNTLCVSGVHIHFHMRSGLLATAEAHGLRKAVAGEPRAPRTGNPAALMGTCTPALKPPVLSSGLPSARTLRGPASSACERLTLPLSFSSHVTGTLQL